MYKILANTIFLGKDIHFLPVCHSSNDIALRLVREKQAMEGTIVVCADQIRGKGQRGNAWETQAGKNLTFSLVLKPDFLDLTEQFYLNMAISNAIRKIFEEYVSDIQVKWPNDLVVPGFGKIGGILIENILGTKGWEYAVVGIGLNINQEVFSAGQATSLKKLTGSEFDLEEIFRLLIIQIEQNYIRLRQHALLPIKQEYLRYLFLWDSWQSFDTKYGTVNGKISGINPLGKLELTLENGEIQFFDFKEIRFPSIGI
ncbi:biotin--[acetyl-CoA-carboxylase] ligase [Algoriphagus sp.]|uniref:biotin--[acetyl-CoA-carboxylase] ligase n=1 Tax=Algoriphagus sp. TaxID=1872435 RepID=UPI002622A8C9|nr:biotin--[acetyl-CoA-carboxylase] ligase [Algoriphagus sp.]